MKPQKNCDEDKRVKEECFKRLGEACNNAKTGDEKKLDDFSKALKNRSQQDTGSHDDCPCWTQDGFFHELEVAKRLEELYVQKTKKWEAEGRPKDKWKNKAAVIDSLEKPFREACRTYSIGRNSWTC